uniref:SFRICE_023729 n=1 Tax=Spodoptera frugiperda TaxID=7108 RepID=A0A2H1WBZ7_SPOFR
MFVISELGSVGLFVKSSVRRPGDAVCCTTLHSKLVKLFSVNIRLSLVTLSILNNILVEAMQNIINNSRLGDDFNQELDVTMKYDNK